MDSTTGTSASGVRYTTMTGAGTCIELEHDEDGDLRAVIRVTEYIDGHFNAQLLKGRVEDHNVAICIQSAMCTGRQIDFTAQKWDLAYDNDTYITSVKINHLIPASKPRRIAAV